MTSSDELETPADSFSGAKLFCLQDIKAKDPSLSHLQKISLTLTEAENSSWSLGRSVNVEVSIPDVQVSRKHATIQCHKHTKWTITDHKVRI